MTIKRIILTTGGTGGHIFPAIAVAEELRRRNPNAMILFIGSKYGIEADIAANAGIDYAGLPVRGVMGHGLRGIASLFAMAHSVSKAISIIGKTQPQLVVGFGGYAAFAATLGGWLRRKPTAIHEQNCFPGVANRILGKLVQRVFLSMPDLRQTFASGKTVLTGNPVRAEITALYSQFSQRLARYLGQDIQQEEGGAVTTLHPKRLLVVGGSLGAVALNRAMVASLRPLLDAGVEVWHQTGLGDIDIMREAYRMEQAEQVRVEPFISNMAAAYDWADLVLCRAGASSLAEITIAGLPSVLVPFPFAAQDHQLHNARYMEQAGAAVVLEQDRFAGGNAQVLSHTILDLLHDREQLAAMAYKSRSLAAPKAVETVVDELEKLLARY